MSESENPGSKGPQSARSESSQDGSYLAGDVIENKYRLVRTLGEGGMGVVWVAHNVILDVNVALKLITLKHGSSQPLLAKRLLQEARTAAQLGHPAICRVFDYGQTHHGDPFVVSELLHGETLGDLLHSDTRLPATRAVQILLPIIDALAVAHQQGIVHRDVKPDNIFLSRDVAGRTQPKLLDFGIARFVETDSQITVDGALLGTPNYMSPEQARGEKGADFRTDVWSVCVVLYEMATGNVPFAGENYNAILYSVMSDTPLSILEHGAGDSALWRLLERGLRKNPEDRWQSLRELGEALALWLYEHGIREDVCGASLRTTWLESGLSDVRMELPGESLQPTPWDDVTSPDHAVPLRPKPREREAVPPARETLDSGLTFGGSLRPGRRKRLIIAGGVIAALVVVGLLFASRSGGGNPAPAATSVAPTTSLAPTPAALPSVASASAADSAAPPVASARPKTKRPARPVSAAPATGKKRRDFGF
jgi:eukaryotic-like serine/threonine-protein kinase